MVSGGGAGHTEDGGDKDGNNSGHVGLAVDFSAGCMSPHVDPLSSDGRSPHCLHVSGPQMEFTGVSPDVDQPVTSSTSLLYLVEQ
ncbi:hypothetical protein Q5P01_000382 [Channa striata]|uniref:Uncharacterized protein n=1 Tax=Channa striata TaxID=64152 RepID=A0AA88IIX1_CHASR|nr:hypothetical protein Q5P01_000382 [Channa striata]